MKFSSFITTLTLFLCGLFPLSAQQAPLGQPGQVSRSAWSNFPVESSIDLLRAEQWAIAAPNNSSQLPLSSIPSDWGNNYGQVLRGYLVAPVTGEYRFWLSAEEEAQLFISSSSDKFASREQISFRNSLNVSETNFGGVREQASAPLKLTSGQRYYFELHHKTIPGDDFVKLNWSYCGGDLFTNWATDPAAIATQSTTGFGGVASRAIDGNTNGAYASGTITHTWYEQGGPWWQVDLGNDRLIDRIEVFNRSLDGRFVASRLRNYQVSVLDAAGVEIYSEIRHAAAGSHTIAAELFEVPGLIGRTVRIKMLEPGQLALAEVKVFGRSDTSAPCPNLENVPCAPLLNWSLDPAAVATQSSTTSGGEASRAIDGNHNGRYVSESITHTAFEANPFWQVDLGSLRHIDRIELFNRDLDRPRAVISSRLTNFRISILDDSGSVVAFTDRHPNDTHTFATEFWETGGVMGQVVRVEILGWGRLHLSEVRILGRQDPAHPDAIYQPMAPVPDSVLESYAGSLSDLDEDQLRDSWEIQYGFDPTIPQTGDFSANADPDNDGLTNYQESRFQTDPNSPSSVLGQLIAETWIDLDGNDVANLIESDAFYAPAAAKRAIDALPYFEIPAYTGARLRGQLIAPRTGTYHFWLSAQGGAQLFLSSDSTKFQKQKIAELGGDIGTGHGVDVADPSHWDYYSSQLSEGIHLVEGETYFFEILSKLASTGFEPHVHVAWAIPGEDERTELPIGALSSYGGDLDDLDDDYLPDTWETQYGLDATDNGFTDRARQGERGDYDSDGLTNHEEYLYGTDPTNSDSDGDGLSDSEEIHTYGTDPGASDSTPESILATLDLTTVSGLGDTWTETGSGILTTSFRGQGTWSFDVPTDGFYIVQLEAKLRGSLRQEELMPVIAQINGERINRSTMRFLNGGNASLRLVTPYLHAGTHDFGFVIDNYIARRSLEVLSVKLIIPGGIDADGNGVPDEIENTLDSRSHLTARAQFSHYSPAFVEGRVSSLSLVDLTTINRTGTTSRVKRYTDSDWAGFLPNLENKIDRYADRLQTAMRMGNGRMEGTARPHQAGAGHHSWYAKLPLNRNEALAVTAQFENFGTYQNQIIAWTPYNVLDGGMMRIPVGSDLLLGAWLSDSDNKDITLDLNGSQIAAFKANESHVQSFAQVGTYTITATHENGPVNSLTVQVCEALIQDNIAIPENAIFDLSLPSVDGDLSLDGGAEINIHSFGDHPTLAGSLAQIGTTFPGKQRLAARMGLGQNDILHTRDIDVIGYSDGLRNGTDVIIPQGDGLMLVRSPLVIIPLPAGVTVEVVIFAGGVTFPDGTTTKFLTAADFDQNGVHTLEFLMPVDRVRAPCHYIRLRDANGNVILGGN